METFLPHGPNHTASAGDALDYLVQWYQLDDGALRLSYANTADGRHELAVVMVDTARMLLTLQDEVASIAGSTADILATQMRAAQRREVTHVNPTARPVIPATGMADPRAMRECGVTALNAAEIHVKVAQVATLEYLLGGMGRAYRAAWSLTRLTRMGV